MNNIFILNILCLLKTIICITIKKNAKFNMHTQVTLKWIFLLNASYGNVLEEREYSVLVLDTSSSTPVGYILL